jgi:large subunit ribosomal protein L23
MGFIIKPLVTEKMTKITDKSSVARSYTVKKDKKDRQGNVRVAAGTTVNLPVQVKYGFIVKPEANKIEIKKEIEGQYNVTVEAVNTMKYAGKRSQRYTKAGLVRGHKNAFKKVIVTLKEGDSIDFYSNIE